MKSLVKISILLEIVTLLMTTPASARGIIINDEYKTLADEEQTASNTPAVEVVEVSVVEVAEVVSEPESNENEIATAEVQPEEKLEVASEPSESVDVASTENTANTESDDSTFESASLVSTEDMEENRGAFSPVNTSYLLGTSSNNSVTNSVTGGNVIADGAFDSSSGLVNVIQNSGNNVLIQSSTIVNVEMNQ